MANEQVVSQIPESEATRLLREQEAKKAADLAAASTQSVKPGSVVMSEQDYQNALVKAKEEARKEEKEKLYNRIKRAENLEKAQAELKTQIVTLEKQVGELQKAPQPAKIESVSQVPDDIIKVVVETATSDLRKQVTDLTTMLKNEQETKRQTSLQLLRESLIKESNGKIIESLVTGNTEDELRANAEHARQEYDAIVARIAPAAPATPAAPAPQNAATTIPSAQPTTPPASIGPMTTPQVTPSSASPMDNAQEADFVKQIGNMSNAEYSKQRDAIQKRLKELYPPGQKNPMMS